MANSEALDEVVGQVVATLPNGTEYRQVLTNPVDGDTHVTPDGRAWIAVHEEVVNGTVFRTPLTIHWRPKDAVVEVVEATSDRMVRIVAWPEQPAHLDHTFASPVTVQFGQSPATVNMEMNLAAKEAIPICIRICEPICVVSDYRITIDIFDKPFASISVTGQTRLFDCRDNKEPSA